MPTAKKKTAAKAAEPVGAAMAAEAIDSGKARQTLRALAALSNGQDPE